MCVFASYLDMNLLVLMNVQYITVYALSSLEVRQLAITIIVMVHEIFIG